MTAPILKICVPSKSRAEIFAKKTLAILKHTSLPWAVFVEPHEVLAYKKYASKSQIVVLRESDQGLGYSLNTIREHCLSEGVKFVWKMDDDIHHWYSSPRVISKEQQGKLLDSVLLNVLGAGLAIGSSLLGGISFPSNYFHTDWRDFTHVNKMFETTYIVRVENWFVPPSLRGYHEEFVASASLLAEEKVILRTGKLAWSADLSSFSGGLQAFDRQYEQEKFYNVLERQFPKLARMTERQSYKQKTGKTFTVTNKKVFNRKHSFRLPLDGKPKPVSEEVLECLSALE